MITAVTAFVPIPGHSRAEEEYRLLAEPLLKLANKIPLMSADGDLEHCWLHRHLNSRFDMDTSKFSHSVSDDPHKNSVAYHCVQAQKSEWLLAAAQVDPVADVFVWIDYGIFHIPGITTQIVSDFLHRAENEQIITIPGCWDNYIYDDAHPCWRFCGGVMIVPRAYLARFDAAMKREYVRWIELTNNVSWEVNTLARVEQLEPDVPIWWYHADHDKTLFTNYQTTQHADRPRLSTVTPRYEQWLT